MTPEERARLDELLRIPSVSADPAHAGDMRRAAEFLVGEVARAGGEAEVRDLGGHPLVVGEVPPSGGGDAPEVILYGHYDVQPPGPRERWTSDPFEPVERDGNLYCRGASDDKGNLFMLVAAVQRLAAEGRLPVRARFVIDGEEESEGDSAEVHFEQTASSADAAVIFDIQMVRPGLAALCTGLRGLVYRRVTVRTARADAHSGLYGGPALNANHALMRVLHDVAPRAGRLPDSLYAGIVPPTDDEVAAWSELPPGAEMLEEAGLAPADAGAAEAFYARTFAEPSLDVHALQSGHADLVATVIPAVASATLSLRVAPGQDAAALGAELDRLLLAAAPEGAEIEIEALGQAGSTRIDPSEPALVAAGDGIERVMGTRPACVHSGGSIPVVATLAAAGVPTVLGGFALPTDAIHSPDEHLRVEHLGLGARAAMEILTELGGLRDA